MIESNIANALMSNRTTMVINSDNVATLRTSNTLTHALMILTNVHYTAVPVLDERGFVRGVIALPDIIQGVIDDEAYNWSLLDSKLISDVMSTEFSRVRPNAKIEEILHELVEHNFVVVADAQDRFYGIITRKEMFSRVNSMAHLFNEKYNVTPKLQDSDEDDTCGDPEPSCQYKSRSRDFSTKNLQVSYNS